MADQVAFDSLRGELREEKEYAAALKESKRDAERILSKKIGELTQVRGQRDQLLEKIEEHQEEALARHAPPRFPTRLSRRDEDLYAVANSIREDS